MSNLFKTEHYEMVMHAGDMEWVPAEAHLAPRRPARRPELSELLRLPARGKVRQGVLSGAAATSSSAAIRGGTTALNDDFDQYVEKYYGFWHRLAPEPQACRTLPATGLERGDRDMRHDRRLPRRRFPDHELPPSSPEDYVNASLYFEAKTFLHGLLVVEDKLSMAHWLETRVPFLDNDLVDFAQRLPVG